MKIVHVNPTSEVVVRWKLYLSGVEGRRGVSQRQHVKHAYESVQVHMLITQQCKTPSRSPLNIPQIFLKKQQSVLLSECFRGRLLSTSHRAILYPNVAFYSNSPGRAGNTPGFAINVSSSRASSASWRPSTNFAYSSCSFDASVFLILKSKRSESSVIRTYPNKEDSLLFNFVTKSAHTSGSRIQHGTSKVNAEWFNTNIV